MTKTVVRLTVLLLAAATLAAQSDSAGWGRSSRTYDGKFTFVRLHYGSGFGGGRRGMSNAWNHDFPRAEQNLMSLLKELTFLDANTSESLILALDDPQLFRYPVAMMWEPGFWEMTDAEAERFRTYLLKGGMAIFDDFEQEQLENFVYQIRRVLPGAQLVKLDASHVVFDSFFRMKTIDFPHPMFGYLPNYYGIFEDNDPRKRLLVIANHNADVAEYWEFLGRGLFPVDPSNEAYKLGVNYYIYAMTH
jgi:hypothetical protein